MIPFRLSNISHILTISSDAYAKLCFQSQNVHFKLSYSAIFLKDGIASCILTFCIFSYKHFHSSSPYLLISNVEHGSANVRIKTVGYS